MPKKKLKPWESVTSKQYVAALVHIAEGKHDRDLLVANYKAEKKALTNVQMAKALRHRRAGDMNLWYANLARRICKYLQVDEPADATVLILVEFEYANNGMCNWVLRPALAKAIKTMGWV